MEKKVYMVVENLYDHHCGDSLSIVGVFNTKEKAESCIEEIVNRDILSKDFFMANDFDKALSKSLKIDDYDLVSFTPDCVELYCDGNGDKYDLWISEQEVVE